jgi:hypothetical protein
LAKKRRHERRFFLPENPMKARGLSSDHRKTAGGFWPAGGSFHYSATAAFSHALKNVCSPV